MFHRGYDRNIEGKSEGYVAILSNGDKVLSGEPEGMSLGWKSPCGSSYCKG